MKTTHFSPKLLPWLASQAGISLRRAEVLWQAAQRHAQAVTGETATPACAQAAMDRLFELVAAESLREDVAALGWRNWSRLNKRLWQAPLNLLDAFTLAALRGWRLMRPIQPG